MWHGRLCAQWGTGVRPSALAGLTHDGLTQNHPSLVSIVASRPNDEQFLLFQTGYSPRANATAAVTHTWGSDSKIPPSVPQLALIRRGTRSLGRIVRRKDEGTSSVALLFAPRRVLHGPSPLSSSLCNNFQVVTRSADPDPRIQKHDPRILHTYTHIHATRNTTRPCEYERRTPRAPPSLLPPFLGWIRHRGCRSCDSLAMALVQIRTMSLPLQRSGPELWPPQTAQNLGAAPCPSSAPVRFPPRTGPRLPTSCPRFRPPTPWSPLTFPPSERTTPTTPRCRRPTLAPRPACCLALRSRTPLSHLLPPARLPPRPRPLVPPPSPLRPPWPS